MRIYNCLYIIRYNWSVVVYNVLVSGNTAQWFRYIDIDRFLFRFFFLVGYYRILRALPGSLCTFITEGPGATPGQGTKIPEAAWCSQKTHVEWSHPRYTAGPCLCLLCMWRWESVNASLLIYPSPIKCTTCYLLNREMDAPTFNTLYSVYHIHHAGYQYSRPCVGAQRAGSPEWPGSAPALQTATLHREHTVLRFNCSSGPKGTKASPLLPVCARLIEQTTVCASDLQFPKVIC